MSDIPDTNTLVVKIIPATAQVVQIIGTLTATTQDLLTTEPDKYVAISDANSIQTVWTELARAGMTLGNYSISPDTVVCIEDGIAVVKPDVATIKVRRIAMLQTMCAEACIGGAISNSLGSPHFYPTSLLDQQNLAASVTASLNPLVSENWSVVMWCCVPGDDTTWALRAHTKQQIQSLGEDVLRAIETHRVKLRDLVATISRVPDDPIPSNAEYVQSIVWE